MKVKVILKNSPKIRKSTEHDNNFLQVRTHIRYTCCVNKKLTQERALEISRGMEMLKSKFKNSQKLENQQCDRNFFR